jgi:GT2 family glycosyltransferase
MIDVSISIVSYNTRDLLLRCLQSIFAHTKGISFEVIVVDNNSHDGTVDAVRKKYPQVNVIANTTNKYFAANNQAFAIAKGTYVLILNADTYFVDNSVTTMKKYMDTHAKVGACEGVEIYENGAIMASGSKKLTPLIDFYLLSLIGVRLADKKLINNYKIAEKDRSDTFEVEVGCDAFLMVRRNLLEKIHGYDEKLKLFYTENDLCLRIQQQAFQILHLGSAKVMHRVSASTSKLGWKKQDIYYADMLQYYKKHGYVFSGSVLFLLLKCEEYMLQVREKIQRK